MSPTEEHYQLMDRLLGWPEKRRVFCNGRQTERGYCVGALCPQCRGVGYLLREGTRSTTNRGGR